MIPKPGKDRTKVKGWRPIVLTNTVGKLGEKVMANKLQRVTDLFHTLRYCSRINRSAIDSMMIITSTVQKEIAKGNQATLLGKDVVSAFNNVRTTKLLAILRRQNLEQEADFCQTFRRPRAFQLTWDSEERGKARMDDGAPQGSPLSPVLWLIYIANSLKRADLRCNSILPTPRRSSARLTALKQSSISVYRKSSRTRLQSFLQYKQSPCLILDYFLNHRYLFNHSFFLICSKYSARVL